MSRASSAGPLWRVSIETTPEAEEAVAALLESVSGQTASIFTDAETNQTSVSVFLLRKSATLHSTLRKRAQELRRYGINYGSGGVSIRRVRKEDWAESWKRHFKPFSVGPADGQQALLVKPSWSRRKAARNQQVVVIDPGLSFGTGQHPTTRFCLQQLVEARNPRKRQSFLDVGTGSGILAIGAAKLGYEPVDAFDFDPASLRVSIENAKKNRVHVKIQRGDITKFRRATTEYDVVCANLTADLLVNCAKTLKSLVKADGWLILAGILRMQIAEVTRRYKKLGFHPRTTGLEEEWASLVLRKRE